MNAEKRNRINELRAQMLDVSTRIEILKDDAPALMASGLVLELKRVAEELAGLLMSE